MQKICCLPLRSPASFPNGEAGARGLEARRIVAAIAEAATRWCDADFPPRVRVTRALCERLRYTEPVVDYALDRLFGSLERSSLTAAIAGELGTLAALDGFVAREGRPDVFFRGVNRVAILASDTTIGVAVPALAFALCAKARVIVKDREDRLVRAFAETLIEERPELAPQIIAEEWRGADESASRARLAEADTVVAYGRDETLVSIRAQLKADATFVGFGHRTSIGYVAREALGSESAARSIARDAARAALLYDGDGCLSLHALFVERGAPVDVAAFASILAAACDAVAVEFPAYAAEPDARVSAYRRDALFRAAQGNGSVYSGVVAPHVVAFEPPRDEPPPLLPRTLALYGVDSATQALAFVRSHRLPLEAVGIGDAAGDPVRADIEAFAIDAGASRVAPLAALQDPPLGGEHGGAGRILPFVRAIYRG